MSPPKFVNVPQQLLLMLLLAALVAALNACGGDALLYGSEGSGENDATESEIVGGSVDLKHHAVGQIGFRTTSTPSGIWGCSATLISPMTAITAAHCLEAYSQIRNDHFGSEGRFAPIRRILTYPGYQHWDYRTDVAVVQLADVADLPVMRLGKRAPRAGDGITMVGFGCDQIDGSGNKSGYGVRRKGADQIDRVDATNIHSSGLPGTCSGDSGGATLGVEDNREVLWGVHSAGNPNGWISLDVRVDLYAGWVKANTVSVLKQSLWRGGVGYTRHVPVIGQTIDYAAATKWVSFGSSGLPGSGAILAQDNTVIGDRLHQSFWRSDYRYARTVPVIDGQVRMDKASAWSAPLHVSTRPGSGSIQTENAYVLSGSLRESYWRGNVGRTRTVPLASNGQPDFSRASAWSAPIDLSALPGTGDMQTETSFVLGDSLKQSYWRGNQGRSRVVPISNGQPSFSSAGPWSLPMGIDQLPGSGALQAQSSHLLH